MTVMELELARHDWAVFTGGVAATEHLPRALRHLFAATDADAVRHHAEYIRHCAADDGLLADVSPAIAAALVHGIWTGASPGRDEALDILTDIAHARVSDLEPDAYGIVSEADCMAEIARGLPVYAEILEVGEGPVDACVDLIFTCGDHDPWTRDRAISYFTQALALHRLRSHHDQLRACLTELERRG
ncbi:hypothetical protein GCM10009557_31500 [Virgisporangium ochraceum]